LAKTPKNHNKPWTPMQVKKLEQMAARRPVGIIAYELGRTTDAVRAKANEEGFSMKPPERKPYNRRP